MDHTHIVQASDLDRYAPTRESQAVIPELVYWLVKRSCPDVTVCRIPYGDVVNQPGKDGLVETVDGFDEFVPKGNSYWEIGTGKDPEGKATDDYKKRTEKTSDQRRAGASFVFVTPRSSASGGWSEPDQDKWLEQRQVDGWKSVRVIDGVKLADWIREFPAIGRWMATKIPLTPKLGGLSTAAEHWHNVLSECAAGDPRLPAKLFTVGRAAACEALQALFEGKTQNLLLFAESPQDVDDFVAGFLAGLPPETSQLFINRCLYVSDEEAWRSIVETRSAHVLIAHPRLGLDTEEGASLQTIARRKGHSVVVPLCGAWSGNNPEILKLRSPTQSEIESVLRESEFSDTRARELARIGGDRISALRRHLRGYGALPPYATWGTAALLAQAGLIGKWDGSNPADRAALERLLGKGYGEWIEMLRPDTLRSDSPLIQQNEKWRFVARGEAWDCLGNRITDADLDRYQEMAIAVLSERDPKFDLSKEERYAAAIHGKALKHSSIIRNGVAETLALMGSRHKALSSCSDAKGMFTAVLVVRSLLQKAEWDRWASLDSFMPLLAEAAPDEFLDAVELALIDLGNTPFHRIFAEEGSSGFGGWNYMSGLLWALETLAWSPEFLSRVSVILADIASFDPGGNWANRPANSLADIFLPWHVQTTAPFDKRRSAVEAVIREQPTVGWKLLLALLPHNHGATSGCHRPVWRDFIPRNWSENVSTAEYWQQIIAYTDLAVVLAKSDSGKLCELISRLPDLPQAAHEKLLEHLKTDAVVSLPEADRLPLWESLDQLVRSHRKFSDADWAMPEDAVIKIAEAAQALAPTSPAFKYHQLFDGRDFDLYAENDDFEEQRKQLDLARQGAISEVEREGGIDAVLKFAGTVSAPYEVGRALGITASTSVEASLLPSLLKSTDDTAVRVAAGFVWARFWELKMDWVDSVLARGWSPDDRAKFLTLLPFREEVWQRVSTSLAASHEGLYWREVKVNPYAPEGDVKFAIEKLLEFGREGAAVMCVARFADSSARFDESLAARALLAAIGSERGVAEMDNYRAIQVIKRLQESETSDKDALFRIEWNLLPWLGRFSSGSPITLEKRLASDPVFFAEAIGLVFRSKTSSEAEPAEPDERKRFMARNAYRLLTEWKRCPGTQGDGTFSSEAFKSWLDAARAITEESGHAEVAQIQIGHVLTCAPPDPDGLWIHDAVAAALNARDAGEMRSGFTTQLFNDRGVHGFTHGEDERKLATENREKAEALESRGYTRFATAMRQFAEQYALQAEREAKRNPFDPSS